MKEKSITVVTVCTYLLLVIAGDVFHCEIAGMLASSYMELLALVRHMINYRNSIFRSWR